MLNVLVLLVLYVDNIAKALGWPLNACVAKCKCFYLLNFWSLQNIYSAFQKYSAPLKDIVFVCISNDS